MATITFFRFSFTYYPQSSRRFAHAQSLCPTEWRLACQMVLRDEDISVDYPSK